MCGRGGHWEGGRRAWSKLTMGMAEGLIILKRVTGWGGAMGQWHGFGQCRASLAWLFAKLLWIMMGGRRERCRGEERRARLTTSSSGKTHINKLSKKRNNFDQLVL